MQKLIFPLSAVVVCAGIAHAQTVVYEQLPEAADLSGFFATTNHINDQRLADDFTLASDTSISELTWWGFVFDPASPFDTGLATITNFVVQFYAADGIGGLPSTLIAGETIPLANITTTIFGNSGFNGDTFEFTASLATPVALNGAIPDEIPYWVAINATMANTGLNDPIYVWLFQGDGGGTGTLGDGFFAGDGVAPNLADGIWESVVAPLNGLSFQLSAGVDSDGDGLLDSTEIDIASGGSCPDPFNPDSDGDTLSDGAEVTAGTNPCLADTDGDGLPDNLDPNPTNPDIAMGDFEFVARVVANEIAAADIALFTGPNANASRGRSNSLSTRVHNAANAITIGDYATAADLLDGVYVRLDGDPEPNDWMEPSTEKDLLADYVLLLLTIALGG